MEGVWQGEWGEQGGNKKREEQRREREKSEYAVGDIYLLPRNPQCRSQKWGESSLPETKMYGEG